MTNSIKINNVSLSMNKNEGNIIATALVTLSNGEIFIANVIRKIQGFGFYITLGGAIDANSELFDSICKAVRKSYLWAV